MKLKNPFKKFKKQEKKLGWLKFIASIILGLAVLVVVFFSLMMWGIYKLDWQNNFIESFVKIVPLPAAKVDSQYVPLYAYYRNLDAVNKFYDSQKKSGFGNVPSASQIKKIVLEDRLIKNIFVARIAQSLGLNVTSSDVEQKYSEIEKNKGSKEELQKFLADYYGLSPEEYKEYFILPNLYYDKVEADIENSATINGEAKKKIDEALTKIKAGQDFDAVAKEYSEDDKFQDSSLTGKFLKGELSQTLEDQLFAMKKGQYTDVVTLSGSYSIIKLEDKNEDKGSLTLKSIMVKTKNINDLIDQEKAKSKINTFAY